MDNVIYSYTLDQAIEDGEIAKLSEGIYATRGVMALQGKGFNSIKEDYLFVDRLAYACIDERNKQPEVSTDGGNDKSFFTFTWRGTNLFAVKNEANGITIMLPDEY